MIGPAIHYKGHSMSTQSLRIRYSGGNNLNDLSSTPGFVCHIYGNYFGQVCCS